VGVSDTYGADMEFKFNPSVSLKGVYYRQNL